MRVAGAFLLSILLAACGGGGAGDMDAAKVFASSKNVAVGDNPLRRGDVLNLVIGGVDRSPRWGGGGTPPIPPAPAAPEPLYPGRVEQSDASVVFAGAWSPSDARWGWSGGSALQSSTAGASVTFTFTGSSVRWIGSRGRAMGIAQVSIDGVVVKEVDLFARPTDLAHAPVFSVYDLAYGRHTLTITVTGRQHNEAYGANVVVDAFDVQLDSTISHWQDTNPELKFTGAWSKSVDNAMWSGSGVANKPELPVTAQETSTAGDTMTVPFRGNGIGWIGYRGPDAGIAQVQVDGGPVSEVDLYAPSPVYQPIVFAASGFADADHTLRITATGRKNPASTAARVVVDAFDVMTPGRRYEDDELTRLTFTGKWNYGHLSRVWSQGYAATSNLAGSTVSFAFTGTSVSWIGCQKGSASGRAKVYIDGVFIREVNNNQNYPIEGYQMTVFRADGLSPGAHTLTLEITSNSGYVVVDAFDVRP